jgi:hypothetical protein
MLQSDSGRTADTRPLRCSSVAPGTKTAKAPTKGLSKLNSMAFGLAAYASQCASPRPTQHSLPAAGQALLDGLSTRRIPTKGFRFASYISSPFPKLLGAIWNHRAGIVWNAGFDGLGIVHAECGSVRSSATAERSDQHQRWRPGATWRSWIRAGRQLPERSRTRLRHRSNDRHQRRLDSIRNSGTALQHGGLRSCWRRGTSARHSDTAHRHHLRSHSVLCRNLRADSPYRCPSL